MSTGKLKVFSSNANIGAGPSASVLSSYAPYATGNQSSIQVTTLGKTISMLSVDIWTSGVTGQLSPTNCTVTFVGTRADGSGTVTYAANVTPTGFNGYTRVNFAATPFDNVQINAISFSLSSAANYLSIDNFTFAPAPVLGTQISIDDVSILEGTLGGGTTLAIFTVTRSNNTSVFTADVASSNGTATAGSDYTAVSTTLSFTNGGALSQTVTVPIIKDATVEPNETFNMTLSNATNGTLYLKQVGIGTIYNDDGGITERFEDETIGFSYKKFTGA